MGTIENITINGLDSSETLTPIVSGFQPIIRWHYEKDAASAGQKSIEIKINTNDTNWGLDSFAGNILGYNNSLTSDTYQYDLYNLQRGADYYGQMRVTDAFDDQTTWTKFRFRINQLPFVTSYRLSPLNPTAGDDIELIYTFNDQDSHSQDGTKIRWYRNSLSSTEYDGLCTLPASATAVGDSWTARILPSDGIEFGPPVETSAVTIQEIDSTFESVRILPTDANVDDILKVEYSFSESEYVSTVGIVIIEWYVNNELVSAANTAQEYIRLSLEPGDIVYVIIKLTDGNIVFASTKSSDLIISDVPWYVYDLTVNNLSKTGLISDIRPILNWKKHKTTAPADKNPQYVRVLITKTPSLDGPIHDTGFVEYVKDSYIIPENVLSPGQRYFFHVGADDTTSLDDSQYITKEVTMAGSSWFSNVDNNTGWEIEFKLVIAPDKDATTVPEPSQGIYIHDGKYFCSITFSWTAITLVSGTKVSYSISDGPDLRTSKSFRICGRQEDIRVFMNNKLIIDAQGIFTSPSLLKQIEYGDIDSKTSNYGIWRFFRYSTAGAFGFDDTITDENTFYFHSIGKIKDGSIDYVFNDKIAWTPDDETKSTKIITLNEKADENRLSTVARNYSPITAIHIDSNRNKYLATTNGVTAIFGEKHDPDYILDTSTSVPRDEFDRISDVASDKISLVEPFQRAGWLTIDTTYRTIGATDTTEDEYNPYILPSHAIHYYTQRTHGHHWHDNVDNTKGWQIAFDFDLEILEADNQEDTNIEKHGFGIYVNDGTRQEIIYFYEDRIRLFYANVYVLLNTSTGRKYVIVGKGDNLNIYQKTLSTSVGGFQKILDASGLFTTPSVATSNSYRPKIEIDSGGNYHSVWHDDGNKQSQIIYSTFSGTEWSTPVSLYKSSFSLRNADLAIDSRDRIWVIYEDTSFGRTEISCSVKDTAGWNPRIRITNSASEKSQPAITIDQFDNVHVVWEDNRDGAWKIFWAKWDNTRQAWLSSGQFGTDEAIMQIDQDDPYQDIMDFRNPAIISFGDYIYLVAEGHFKDSNRSAIFSGFKNILTNTGWSSAGAISLSSTGQFQSIGSSEILSDINRNAINPDLASNENNGTIVVAWEDATETISQIWGASISSSFNTIQDAVQITNQAENCKNPSVGFINDQAAILFEGNNTILLSNYNTFYHVFNGSGTGGYDATISIDGDKMSKFPAISNFNISKTFSIAYEYNKTRNSSDLGSIEFPDFNLIGDAVVYHSELSFQSPIPTTSTISNSSISNFDTKEFAFGDFSENVGIRAHWKDISMYFGYNAIPHSISKFNSTTVNGWPDDRINDIFVDSYGNIIAATYHGLIYHNISTGNLINISGLTNEEPPKELLAGKLITAVRWGRNGIWYVGTTDGVYFTRTAGKFWERIDGTKFENKIIHSIAVDDQGQAIIATSSSNFDPTIDGVYVVHPDKTSKFIRTDTEIRVVAVDENNIIWAGGDTGLLRIENYDPNKTIHFNRNQGMRASHINDIAIVNKYLRYIATAAGVEKMNGTHFSSINTKTHAILNDNISSIYWNSSTNSLWIGSLYTLHEIVFKDQAHEIIEDEIVQYNNLEISTEQIYDKDIYYILDQSEAIESISEINTESTKVYINRNPIDFGYSIDKDSQSIRFATDMLVNDQIEISISNHFSDFHDFTQSEIEQSVKGQKRSCISKMDNTSKGQLLLLSQCDKPSIVLYNEAQATSLPFTTIMIDRELPRGCLEQIDTITRTIVRFKLLAFDNLSGIDGYILSNYENFTSDGETPLDYQPLSNIIDHNLGEGITNVFDSLLFADTVDIDANTFNVGNGSSLAVWKDSSNHSYLFAGTSSPAIIYKYDPETDSWTALVAISSNDQNTRINNMRTFFDTIFITTGTTTTGGNGAVYKSVDGINFTAIGSVTGTDARGIVASQDGTIYIGSSDGTIYEYKNDIYSKKYENIGQSIYALDIFDNILVVATGNQGRVYTINTNTGDNLIVFDTSDTYIANVHIKDASTVSSKELANVFVGAGNTTTIYRGNLDSFDFVRSYNSFNNSINRLGSVNSSTLTEPTATPITGTTEIAAIGDSIFKFKQPSWEFLYKHTEQIRDLAEFTTNGVSGVWIISDTRITKWTAVLSEKTVYLRLRDKAGNISSTPVAIPKCPSDENSVCCNYAYSIKIQDLQNFINENRIIDITETGEIVFSYDSTNHRPFFSADKIDEEIGIYTSEVFNGSNDLVSWKTITWESEEPNGTAVNVQIRTGVTEDNVLDADWSANLVKQNDVVSLEHITDQYLQFRVILSSTVRDLSPSLSSVTLRNLTAQASHFFTTNFFLPSRPIKGLLTANTFIPISADVVFGINTKNSVDFGDYQIIEPNRLFTSERGQFGKNIRIGAKLLSPSVTQIEPTNDPGDPYDSSSYICTIDFSHTNTGSEDGLYDFRVRFYTDLFRTQLSYTFFSGNDQTGWSINGQENEFTSGGIAIDAGETKNVSFNPGSSIPQDQKWYVTVDAYNGSFFEIVSEDKSYICATCNIVHESGLVARYYKTGLANLTSLPSFGDFTPDFTCIEPNIDFAVTQANWISVGCGSLVDYIDTFAIRFQGRIQIPTSGVYTFVLSSDDGSRLSIDNSEVISMNRLQEFTSASATIELLQGYHEIDVQYFESGFHAGLRLEWIVPGETSARVIPASRFYHAVVSEYCDGLTIPKILNFAMLFELENGETVKLNL